jgi:hypothetical protein
MNSKQHLRHLATKGEPTLERSLLLQAAAVRRMDSSEPQAWLSSLTPKELDWNKLLEEAQRHGLIPLLSQFLIGNYSNTVPADLLNTLEQLQQNVTFANLRLTGELWEVIELFAKHGIEAVPVKGPTLALLAFDDLRMRQFADLDLLVRETDLAKVAELLVARGYQPWVPLDAVYDETFRRITNVLEFSHSEKGYLVEVHWKLSVDLLPLDLSQAWRERRLTPTFPGGKRIHTFAPEPLLVYLCVHAAKHCWPRLSWAADIAWLIQRQPNFDWEYALTLARKEHCRRTVNLGLMLASDLLGAELPPSVKAEVEADPTGKELAERVVSWWALPEDEAPGPESGLLERSRFFYDIQDDMPSRLRYFGRLLLAPNLGDWKFVRLPVNFIYCYALLRPIRFLLSLLNIIK